MRNLIPHCRRLCKTTETFVTIENVFFYLIFTLTHLVFGFLIFVYIYIYILYICIYNIEAKNFGYSLKNIPIATKQHYLTSMIDKVESLITRLTWKTYFFEKLDQRNSNNSTNFGFKSNVTPPQDEKLTPF